MVLHAFGINANETQLTYEAAAHGWLTEGGTSMENLTRLLELHGVPSHVSYQGTVDALVLARLVMLGKNIGRPIHPIIIGGARYAAELGKNFESCTIIDAQPFLHTFHRRICIGLPDGRITWKFKRSNPIEGLDARFKANILGYADRISLRLKGTLPIRQSEFGFRFPSKEKLRPRRKQAPVQTLPLFGHGQTQSESNPGAVPQRRSEPANRKQIAPQISTEQEQFPSKSELAATRPSSRHRSSLDKHPPNGSGSMNTVGEWGGGYSKLKQCQPVFR
jgi:hypothetical protein